MPVNRRGRYSAGEHLYVEPFVLLGFAYRKDCEPLQLGDYLDMENLVDVVASPQDLWYPEVCRAWEE